MENKQEKMGVGKMLVIALKLLVICGGIALLVAGVYHLTKDKIDLNAMNDTAASLTTMYENDGLIFSVEENEPTGEAESSEDENGKYAYVIRNVEGESAGTLAGNDLSVLDAETYQNIDTVYTIKDADDNILGYCVMASPMGFKDEVGMIVAVNPDITVKAVSIISHSETSGIGSKAAEEGHLAKFAGKAKGFDTAPLIISGATRTSEPVAKAVDEALCAVAVLVNGKEAGGNE